MSRPDGLSGPDDHHAGFTQPIGPTGEEVQGGQAVALLCRTLEPSTQ